MAVRGCPDVPDARAWRMKVFEKEVVDRATHVATVNGLRR
jgi:hypothetical protein